MIKKNVELYNICRGGRAVDNGFLVRVVDNGRTVFVKFDRDEAAARTFAGNDESLAFGLYRAAVIIDDLYGAELRHVFGKHVGNRRYTDEGKGEPGTKLRQLHLAKLEADRLWDEYASAVHAAAGTVSP